MRSPARMARRCLPLVSALVLTSSSVSASLIGDQVIGIFSTPRSNWDVLQPFASPAIVGSGPEFSGSGVVHPTSSLTRDFSVVVDVNAGGFDITLIPGDLFNFNSQPGAIRIDLLDLDAGGTIVGLNVDFLSLDMSISSSGFGPHSAFVEFEAADLQAGATSSLSFDVEVIPEPSTALLLGLGLVGLAATRRSIRTRRVEGRIVPLLTTLLVVLPAFESNATLIELDLASPGDALLTWDTSSGLAWLDLTETTGLSYNQVEADVGGWVSLGFRHAVGSEVCGLFGAYGAIPDPCPTIDNSYVAAPSDAATVDIFLDRLGRTGGSYGLGMFDDSNNLNGTGQGYYERVSVVDGPLFIVRQNVYSVDDTHYPDAGHFLVRPVPEPNTALLLSLGLVGLSARRRSLRS